MAESAPLSHPAKSEHGFKKAAILFSGGPAPAANAVISTCAASFRKSGIEVVGVLHGYRHLMEYSSENPMQEGRDYLMLDDKSLKRTRNQRGIIIGTARANPGKLITSPADLRDAEKSAPMKTTYEALCSLGVDALISIGGDDTLKTANKFKLYQDTLSEGSKKIPVVHIPKTIDNDYHGIDFTFGYFTAVEVLGGELRNLLADAEASESYFVAECMGRSAGWLAYGAAIASEASLVVSVEDIKGDLAAREEWTSPKSGEIESRKIMNIKALVGRIVKTMRARDKSGKRFGTIVMAEGLAEMMPASELEGIPRDDHGHISVAHIDLGKKFAKLIATEYKAQTGDARKITGLQLGYESRCASPTAFDVMLGSQLGVGGFRAIVEERLNGVMVSIVGQLELRYVPFEELVNPEDLVTKVRFIETESDFHKLARFLETHVD
ncbi:MAG: 6-phosphofructokinase [Planctomycetota bacterium]|nr:6-phosphofructokinase [Planctomycetota bacterium]